MIPIRNQSVKLFNLYSSLKIATNSLIRTNGLVNQQSKKMNFDINPSPTQKLKNFQYGFIKQTVPKYARYAQNVFSKPRIEFSSINRVFYSTNNFMGGNVKDERRGEIWTSTLPTNDIVFKEVFEKNLDLLKELINDVLCIEDIEVQDIETISTHQTEILRDPSHILINGKSLKVDSNDDQIKQIGLAKKNYVDVKVRDKKTGSEYIVEVQVGFNNDDYKRFSAYAYQSFIDTKKPVYIITFCSSQKSRRYKGIFKEIFEKSPVRILKPLDTYNLDKNKNNAEEIELLINQSRELAKSDVTKIFINIDQYEKIRKEGESLSKLASLSEFFVTGKTSSQERGIIDIQEKYNKVVSDPEIVNRIEAFETLKKEGRKALEEAEEKGAQEATKEAIFKMFEMFSEEGFSEEKIKTTVQKKYPNEDINPLHKEWSQQN